MSNPLFQMFGGNNLANMPQLVRQFQQFKQSFKGNPRQQVQEMLNSGRITQTQYNKAVEQANALAQMLKDI